MNEKETKELLASVKVATLTPIVDTLRELSRGIEGSIPDVDVIKAGIEVPDGVEVLVTLDGLTSLERIAVAAADCDDCEHDPACRSADVAGAIVTERRDVTAPDSDKRIRWAGAGVTALLGRNLDRLYGVTANREPAPGHGDRGKVGDVGDLWAGTYDNIEARYVTTMLDRGGKVLLVTSVNGSPDHYAVGIGCKTKKQGAHLLVAIKRGLETLIAERTDNTERVLVPLKGGKVDGLFTNLDGGKYVKPITRDQPVGD